MDFQYYCVITTPKRFSKLLRKLHIDCTQNPNIEYIEISKLILFYLLDLYDGEFIQKFQNNWNTISWGHFLSERFIIKFQNKVNWYYISSTQILSEQFIENYKDKLHWLQISRKQKLSESFIEKFRDKVEWHNIYAHQKLSPEFKKKWSFMVED